jgi:multiple sugar transport system permease protein
MTEPSTSLDPGPGTRALAGAPERAPAPRRGALERAMRRRDTRAALVMLLPGAVLALLFMAYPIASTLWMSLNRVNQFGQIRAFAGLDNYANLLADAAFQQAFLRTVVWTVSVVGVTTTVALFLASVLNRRFRGRAVARALLLLPWAASLVVSTLLWRWMANPDLGVMNDLLRRLGLEVGRLDWMANPDLSFPLMIWIAIWASIPPTTLILLAGLQSIDPNLPEAAALDGARGTRAWFDITLPMLRPVLAVSILLNVVFVFNSFPIIWGLTEGGPAGRTDTLVTYLYKVGFRLYDMGAAAAVSVIMFLVLLVFALVHTRLTWRNVLR